MPSAKADRAPELFTIGHSTHPIGRFLELLEMERIAFLADVRSFPSSRRWPQFNQSELARSVESIGIEYRCMRLLGGRRHPVKPDSPHIAWTHPAFRSYADYMASEDFKRGLAELIGVASSSRTAMMCSEGLWWRCHRRIVSDNLVLRGWRVIHMMPDGKLAGHQLTEFASTDGGRLVYDGGRLGKNLMFNFK